MIGVYANRLADLASSDAPQRFNSAATLLGDNLTSLSSTFGTLSGAGDPTANKYIGPISKLVGAIGEMILENKRDQLITAGIQSAAPQVDDLLILIKNDLDKIFSLQASAGGNQRFATLASAYNNEDRTKLSYEVRKQRLAEIKDAARRAGGRRFFCSIGPSHFHGRCPCRTGAVSEIETQAGRFQPVQRGN